GSAQLSCRIQKATIPETTTTARSAMRKPPRMSACKSAASTRPRDHMLLHPDDVGYYVGQKTRETISEFLAIGNASARMMHVQILQQHPVVSPALMPRDLVVGKRIFRFPPARDVLPQPSR